MYLRRPKRVLKSRTLGPKCRHVSRPVTAVRLVSARTVSISHALLRSARLRSAPLSRRRQVGAGQVGVGQVGALKSAKRRSGHIWLLRRTSLSCRHLFHLVTPDRSRLLFVCHCRHLQWKAAILCAARLMADIARAIAPASAVLAGVRPPYRNRSRRCCPPYKLGENFSRPLRS